MVLLLAWMPLPPAFAQEKPAEKPAPASTPQDFSKEAYTIERISTRVTAENDGTGTREASAEVKVLADAGVKAFAVLNFLYTSANEVVEIDYVRVRKPDGTVVKTPDYNIQDMPGEVTRTAPLYSDIHEKHVAVKGLGVGDVLEYLVRYRVVKPLVPGQFWHEYSFTKDAIAREERLEISVPLEKYLKVVSPEFKPEVSQEGTRRVYRWRHSNLQVKEKDPDEAPRRTPPNPDVQLTTFASWEDVGRWYGGLQKEPLAVTPAIQAKSAELTKGLKTDEEKIRAIYSFVSLKYHYIGLDFGIGRYQPHAADDVLDNGYGDCKDKHTLLAALLKAAGIEAWPALIHTQRKLDPELPSPAQFNHVITVVPNGPQFIWLDTTPEVAPYGLLLLALRGKQALVIPADRPPSLMTTPENPLLPEYQEFSAEGKLGADGTFTGHIEQHYRGDSEVLMRTFFRQVSESQWKEAVQRFSYGLNFGGDVSNVKMSPADDLDKPFTLSYDYVRKNYSDWENRRITAPLPPIGLEIVKGTKEIKPVEPVLLGGVGKITYHARVELPAGYFPLPPANCHLVESFAEYTDETQVKNGVMTTTRELVVKKGEVPLSDWETFSKFGHAIADDEFAYIQLGGTFTSMVTIEDGREEELRQSFKSDPANEKVAISLGAMLIRRSKYPDAIKILEAAVDAAPDNAILQYQLGQAYLKSGDHDKGLSHLRDAIEQQDDDALMLNNVAYTLAENKSDLGLAREYAGKALDELDDQAQSSGSSDQAGLRVTYLYSLAWDTMGWVYFEQGDMKRAEGLIQAAWLLGEESVVAEHLGQVYEKEGKTQKAARQYEYALAVSSATSMYQFSLSPEARDQYTLYKTRESEIKARYKKLTGKEVSLNETWRLPNGEWTQTPAEHLRHTREVKLSNQGKLSGRTQFIVEIKPGKVASAHHVSGDDALEALATELVAAHYPLEFPPDSAAILTLRVDVNCQTSAPCIAALVNPVPARP